MAVAAEDASVSAGSVSSSEYAKPVFSPLIARTPTPCSVWLEPDLTMPSSKNQLSETEFWK